MAHRLPPAGGGGGVSDLAAQWVCASSPHKACLWAGLGVALCAYGGRLRYTTLFFPILRVADLETLEQIEDNFARVAQSALATPVGLHPHLWRTAQNLLLNVATRSCNTTVLLEIACSGVVACATLGLADAPSTFVALRLARWRGALADASMLLRTRVALKASTMACDMLGASSKGCLAAQVCALQLGALADLWLSTRIERPLSIAVNCALGAELIRGAMEGLLPEPGPFVGGLLDGICVITGVSGLLWQAVQMRVMPPLPHIYKRLQDKLSAGRAYSFRSDVVTAGDAMCVGLGDADKELPFVALRSRANTAPPDIGPRASRGDPRRL